MGIKTKSPYFDRLKKRVQERGIYINEEGYPKSSVWTSYRREYEDSDITFTIIELLRVDNTNKVKVQITEGDYEETFITNLSLKTSKDVPGYRVDLETTDDFIITEKMKKGMEKFCVGIVS